MASSDKQKAMFQTLTDPGDHVALKGILRGSATQKLEALPMDAFSFPEFKVQGRTSIVKPKDEKTLLIESLQGQVADLEKRVSNANVGDLKHTAAALAQGTAAGLAQGLKEGQDKSQAAFDQQIVKLQQDLGQTLQSMNTAYGTRIAEVEAQAVELALGIAKRLFCLEAEIHPQRIGAVIAEGFSHLGQAESLILHLNPLDVVVAQEQKSFWQPLHSSLKSVRIEEDPRVERGGCWIESDGGGTIDLRAQVQWERMEQSVRDTLAHSADSAIAPDSSTLTSL